MNSCGEGSSYYLFFSRRDSTRREQPGWYYTSINSTENLDLARLVSEPNCYSIDHRLYSVVSTTVREFAILVTSGRNADTSGSEEQSNKPRCFSADQALLRRDSAINLVIFSSNSSETTTTTTTTSSSSLPSISKLKRQQKAAAAVAAAAVQMLMATLLQQMVINI